MEEQEDNLDQPSQEDLDIVTELQIAKRKYIRRLDTLKVPTAFSKGIFGSDTRTGQVLNSIEAIESLLGCFEKFKRFKPSQVFFAKKLIRNAAHMDLKNLEKDKDDE